MKIITFLSINALGGTLVGFNAGRLSEWPNILLFVLGLAMINLSFALLGQIWRKK